MTEVTVTDLEQARAAGELVLDVREPDEYAAGHVPGAQSIPLDVLPVRLRELSTDRPVYVVCAVGGRSAHAAQILTRAGINAHSVAGGTEAWVRSGHPVRTGSAA